MYNLYGQNFERRGVNTITAGIILVGMRHAKKSGISSGRLGLWLTCAFFKIMTAAASEAE